MPISFAISAKLFNELFLPYVWFKYMQRDSAEDACA